MGRSGNPAKRAAEQRARALDPSRGPGTRATFYCDESGNTGVNWGDPDQPVFVHGGWLIARSHQDALLAELSRLRKRHRLRAPELKWQQLAKRDNSSAVFREIFNTMFGGGAAVPIFIVMDKDYLLAAKAVETFFDPAYNHFFPMQFASDFDLKKDLAECLLPAPDTLSDFSTMLRSGVEPEAAHIQALASRIADHLQENGATGLAETLRHFTPEAIGDIANELGAATWMRTTLGHSMFALIQRLESFLRPRNVRAEIVHDNIVRFDELLGLVRSMFRESDGSDVLIVNGQIRFFTMPTVDSLRLGDSKEEPFIQFADVLCGFVRTVFTKLKRGQALDDDELAVCGDLVMINHEFYSWEVNVPKATLEQFTLLGLTDLRQRFPH